VVLAHGILGFERIGVGPLTVATYFRGIPEQLRAWGLRVLAPRVHPTAGIARRARKLGERIEAAFPGEAVHIVGHSMGGLDARELLTLPGWSDRVLTLTTVGTPHKGTALAIRAHRRLGGLYRLLETLRWDHRGFLDLQPEAMVEWSVERPEPAGVACFSIAGNPLPEDVGWGMRPFHRVMLELEGPNDGLVGVDSARSFGVNLPDVGIDHLAMMNWPMGVAPGRVWGRVRRMYREILTTIARFDPAYAGEPAGV
jgi:triacylglycerol lipase